MLHGQLQQHSFYRDVIKNILIIPNICPDKLLFNSCGKEFDPASPSQPCQLVRDMDSICHVQMVPLELSSLFPGFATVHILGEPAKILRIVMRNNYCRNGKEPA